MSGIFVILLAAFCSAQDLGSSNKLFGGNKPAPAAKSLSPKASPTKKAPTVNRRAATAKVRKRSGTATAKNKAEAPKAEAVAKTARAGRKKVATTKLEAEAKKAPAVPAKSSETRVRARIATAKQPIETQSSKSSTAKTPTKTPAKTADTNSLKTVRTDAPANTVDSRFKAFSSTKKIEPKQPAPKTAKTVTLADRERYERLIQDGAEARSRRNYEVAENAYSQARSLIPGDPRALSGLGAVYADRERWDESEAAYRSAVEIDPNDPAAQIALSYVLTRPLAVPDLLERYERSEKAARIATRLAPQNAVAFDQLGTALELRGLVGPETENAYRRAIEIDPSFAPARAHLARLLRRRGMTRESDAEYQRAIERAKDVRTRVFVAEIMQSELRFEDSEDLLRNALAQDPGNYRALLLLGRALGTQKKFDEAEEMLRRAGEVGPNGFTANSMLASIYLQQGKVADAERALFNARRSVSASEKGQLARQFESAGDAYERIGKRSDAARLYRIAKTLNSESPTLASKLTATLGR